MKSINKALFLCIIIALTSVFLFSCADKDNDEIAETTAYTEEILPSDMLSEIDIYDDNATPVELSRITSVGQMIAFGSYEQDGHSGNGSEPVEWIVIDIQGNKALLLSRYVLDAKPYGDKSEKITWADSSIRTWLNSDFLDSAFSSEEKEKIQTVNVSNSPEGLDTMDSIFLLSTDEVKTYFLADKSRMAKATAYAKAKGVYTLGGFTEEDEVYNDACRWWLRTPDANSDGSATRVRAVGDVLTFGIDVTNTDIGVRPAMWVKVK